MRSALFAFLCFFISATSFSQTTTGTFAIKGVVQDSVSGKELDYITISLKDSVNKPLKSALTQSNGSFSFEKLNAGKYNLAIVAVGFKTQTIPVLLKQNIDLGILKVSPEANALKDVVITADKPLIKQEVDRISYDVQADPESKVNTVLDMMRKVPLLSLDGEDNIKLNGSSSYKILINGKPSSMVARSPKDILRAMPAANIEKIEVITTPPAKYDSEGLAGIINIITNKKIDNGYNASLNTRYSFPTGGPGGGASFTVKQGKFGISGYGGYGNYDQPETSFSSGRATFAPSNPSLQLTNLSQLGQRTSGNDNLYFGSELSFEIDTLNLITGEIGSWGGGWNSTNSGLSQLYKDGSLFQAYRLNSLNDGDWRGIDLALNYQLGFKSNKNRLLTASYKFSNSIDDNLTDQQIVDRFQYTQPAYLQNNKSSSREQTFQVDYVHPVNKLNIEMGVKGILRDNTSDFSSKKLVSGGEYVIDPAQSNYYENNQDVIGAYNSYSYNTKNWGFKGGLRIEETIIKADFISSNSKVDENYFNVIPSVSVNRKFKDMSSLNLGYTQRIQRPSIWNLNPFIDRSNPNFISYGNPDLVPVLSNNIDFKYTKFKKGSISIGLNYAFANNTVQNVSVYDSVSKITSSTYFNIGKDRKLTSNLNINYPITKKLNFSISGNIGYVWIEGMVNGVLEKNSGLTGYFYTNASYKFEKGWRLSSSFSYSTPYIRLQGKSSSWPYVSFSVNKDIVKDKLSFSASTNNPFSKYRNYQNETAGVNFSQSNFYQNYWRNYTVSLNYRFGKLKDGIKKNKRGIRNDDVSGGKSGGSN